MQHELLIASSWRTRPRGFVALMQLYESNYLWLRQLCGDPALLRGERHSPGADGCALQLRVLEQAAYTVTLQLTHVFTDVHVPDVDHGVPTYPDVRLRVYCDARLVQAQDWAEGQPPAALQGQAAVDRELHQRWARNVMLNKWLEYSLDRGHCFV